MASRARVRAAGLLMSAGRVLALAGGLWRWKALPAALLAAATLAALLWANSPWSAGYQRLWSTQLAIGVEGLQLAKPLVVWVNDLLMSVFFLLVALELKRELLSGELNTRAKAALPALAALGGMLVPALLFLCIAPHSPAARGFGVPMATDIAFALGCLRVLGDRVPRSLVVFLTALAVIDDLGAILVIAFFYTTGVSITALAIALVCTGAMLVLNRRGARSAWPFVLLGLPLWIAVLESGVHPTIAGVVIGLCVPATVAVRGAPQERERHASPLERLEHLLQPWVALLIVPVFALANAGISLSGVALSDLLQPASLGVIAGLLLGKQIGILGASYLAVRSGLAPLPAGASWRALHALSVLAGIGFTMSLFIASLAYGEGSALHLAAKLGVLLASALAAVAGMALLRGAGAAVDAGRLAQPVNSRGTRADPR